MKVKFARHTFSINLKPKCHFRDTKETSSFAESSAVINGIVKPNVSYTNIYRLHKRFHCHDYTIQIK